MTPAEKDFRELVKVLGGAFLLAVLVYAISFTFIQHKREDKGPWTIVFASDESGKPSLVISQPSLNIGSVRLTFLENTVPSTNTTVVFDRPLTNVPFGELVFQDPTFLPGEIMFNFWGHGVEVLPRVLVIDEQEVAWQSNTNIVISGPGKFERRPKKKPVIL